MIAQRTDFAKPRQSTLKAQPLRVFGAAAPQLESQKLPCRLQANLGRTPCLHEASGHAVAGLSSRALEISQEDGRTGGREGRRGFCCSSRQSSRGDCAVALRCSTTRTPKILASRTLPSSCESRRFLATIDQDVGSPRRVARHDPGTTRKLLRSGLRLGSPSRRTGARFGIGVSRGRLRPRRGGASCTARRGRRARGGA